MAYQFDARIRYSEVDLGRKLTLVSLVNYFQDCSTFHSEECGLGMDRLEARHRGWVLLSWQIEIDRRPSLGEHVTVKTWPYGFKAFYGYRNFVLLEPDGTCLARANSVWAFMDTQTGHPAKLVPEDTDAYGNGEPLPMEPVSRKVAVPKESRRTEPFQVCRHHLDTNHHVNNGEYIRMAEEFLPDDFDTGKLRVEYRKQARLHDVIVPEVHQEAAEITVSLCDESGAPYAVVLFEL